MSSLNSPSLRWHCRHEQWQFLHMFMGDWDNWFAWARTLGSGLPSVWAEFAYVADRPPQSEFVPARRMCGSECACQNTGNIMLAKMKANSFHLLKMIKLAPSSGTSSKNVNFYKVNWQVNSSMICSLAHWYIDFIAGYGRNILQSFLQFWICLSKHCLACKIPALLFANK